MPQKPEILILCNNDGGLYKFRRELLIELVQHYHVAVSCPTGDFRSEITALGVEFIDTAVDRRGMNPLRDMRLMRRYIRLIRQRRPLAVLTFTVKPNIYGGAANRLLGKKGSSIIANVTGLGTAVDGGGALGRLVMKMYRYSLEKAYCVFFQNSENLKTFTDMATLNRTELLCGSGVDLEEYAFTPYPDEKDTTRLLFIGRAMKAKGMDELLGAAKRLYDERAPVSIEIVGGCDDESYRDKLTRLTEEGVVTWHGEQHGVGEYLKGCHGVVHPSYHEGMSNVLLEAASTGRPVIASDVAGCRETFINGVSGIAVRPRDEESLYGGIRRFMEIPWDERARMGAAARTVAKEGFDRKIVVKKYLDIIEELL